MILIFQLLLITKYIPAQHRSIAFWASLLARTNVLALDQHVAQAVVDINNMLKRKRKQIGMADLFIAATDVSNNLSLTTLNTKHFERIGGLSVIA